MLRELLLQRVSEAVARLVPKGVLPGGLDALVEIGEPKDPEHGDFACNFALIAAKQAGKPPRAIAEALAAEIDADDLIATTEVAGPGFLNFRLLPEAIASQVETILGLGSDLPQSAIRNPQSLNVEFVSVNPNGPITVGSGRGAAFGSTLCNVLEAAGHSVHREYYINDGTNSEQMRLFADRVNLELLLAHVPGIRHSFEEGLNAVVMNRYSRFFDWLSEGYGDESGSWFAEQFASYVASYPFELYELEVAGFREHFGMALGDSLSYEYRHHYYKYPGEFGKRLAHRVYSCWEPGRGSAPPHMWEREALQSTITTEAVEVQREELALFDVHFHTWFSEQSLHDSGAVQACLDELIAKGAADEETYQLEIVRKKGEPDEVRRVDQPAEGEEESDAEREPDTTDTSHTSKTTYRTGASKSPDSEIRNPKSEIAPTLWLRSTKFGDEKDRVLRRKDGRLTYIASDVAYHKDKFLRGSPTEQTRTNPNQSEPTRTNPNQSEPTRTLPADKLLTILGPDHHGYIGRLRAVVAALLEEVGRGDGADTTNTSYTSYPLAASEALLYRSPEERDACLAALEEAKKKLEVVIFQIVRFVKDGKPAPMRKRDGNIYSLRDLMLEIGKNAMPNSPEEEQLRIGKDVARFFYLMRSHDTHMDFDLDLAEKQSEDNPVFYVQYAHARICSVLRKAEEAGFAVGGERTAVSGPDPGPANRQLLTANLGHPKELALIKKVCDLPYEVARCAEDYGVHRLTSYAVDLARTYHHFYDACRVIQPENPELTRARLALCLAARVGLQGVFGLLGVSAPESMARAEPEPATP